MQRTTTFAAIICSLLLFLAKGCTGSSHSNTKNTFLTSSHSHHRALFLPRGGDRGSSTPPVIKPKARTNEIRGGAPSNSNRVSEDAGETLKITDCTIGDILKGRINISTASKAVIQNLRSSERLPYLISFGLSMVYLYYFSTTTPPKCNDYSNGFCVTNLKDGKCVNQNNSHLWAWHEDIIFTIVAIILPYTNFCDDNLGVATKIAIPAIIFGHGFLHWWISSQDCVLGDLKLATSFYKIFVGALTAIIFFLFSDLPSKRPLLFILAEVAAITFGIVQMTLDKAKDGDAVAALFLASQLMIGYLGAFHPGKLATKLVGQTFVFPCVVSLIEYLKCDWLSKVGGHFWYDFFLHISIISALLPADIVELKAKLTK
uniref:Sugar phosphate transporter domain-containing protein n=1 Tax=Helicotheca tamesis TaxID=374047 RepID=A0A6U0FY02_9STRA|mmetsp:Transcript_16979/g.23303  ORF Transcript_16979/g.23303 Transcript_16979/m.23303 type:complete len:373 (+) Transcript_16979:114-1232(+)|eukprot:CAMPEP_0185724590 /NCGR_PEP_ID=MMETSP1171-20130828/1022_1 /TAXON_ID=374046 /ORGANISM="Helicotheca tamensis, Strain CCMP826" /LENGTH=372 /DNA_ID=CAMNT_0028392471 /DNA_START=89 /DNA_END=1207 /DNA_ORIENTATION=+